MKIEINKVDGKTAYRQICVDGLQYGAAIHTGTGWFFRDVTNATVMVPDNSWSKKKVRLKVRKIEDAPAKLAKVFEAGHWPKPSEAVAARDARNARVADLKAKQEAQDRLERAAPALLTAARVALDVIQKHRFGGMDQNPKGVVDFLSGAIGQAEGTVEAPPRPEFAEA